MKCWLVARCRAAIGSEVRMCGLRQGQWISRPSPQTTLIACGVCECVCVCVTSVSRVFMSVA